MADTTTYYEWTIPEMWDDDWYVDFVQLINQIDAQVRFIESGSADFNAISGNLTIGGSLNVVGNFTLGGSVVSDLHVAADLYVAGSLVVAASAYIFEELKGERLILTGSSGTVLSTSAGSVVLGSKVTVTANIEFTGYVDDSTEYLMDFTKSGGTVATKPNVGVFRAITESGTGANFFGHNMLTRQRGATAKTNSIGILHQHYYGYSGEATGNTTFLAGLEVDVIFQASTGTVGNGYGAYFGFTDNGTQTINNFYGVYIDSVDFADGNNYALYTGTGSVRFGDVVSMVSDLILTGDLIASGSVDISGHLAVGNQASISNTILISVDGITNYGSHSYGLSINQIARGWLDGNNVVGARIISEGSAYSGETVVDHVGIWAEARARENTTYVFGMYAKGEAYGNTNTVYGIDAVAASGPGAIVATAYGARVAVNCGTTRYGLYVQPMTSGTTKYSIYTNQGSARFGDHVSVVGNLRSNLNIYVNADHGVLDEDAVIYFNNPASGNTLKWDFGEQRFEFSKAVYLAGNLTVVGSTILANNVPSGSSQADAGAAANQIWQTTTDHSLAVAGILMIGQ